MPQRPTLTFEEILASGDGTARRPRRPSADDPRANWSGRTSRSWQDRKADNDRRRFGQR